MKPVNEAIVIAIDLWIELSASSAAPASDDSFGCSSARSISVWFRMESTIACRQGAHPVSSADVSVLADASETSGGRDLEQVGHSGQTNLENSFNHF